MVIRKMSTRDFQGLSGTREFNLDKWNAYCLPCGAGKTSFLNALRYGLTGQKPEGEAICRGADRCAVELVLGNGISIIRQTFAGGTSSSFVNRRRSSGKGADETVSGTSGVPVGVMKIASSGDVIKSLKPDEFGKLILGYAREELDAGRLKSYIPDADDAMSREIEEYFGSSVFSVENVRAFHKNLVDRRRALKREIADAEAVIRDANKSPVPVESMESLRSREAELAEEIRKSSAYTEAEKAYRKALADKEARDKNIKKLRDSIAAITAEKKDPTVLEGMEKELEKKRRMLDDAKQAGNSMFITGRDTRKVLEGLATSICPLSEKLVCTTDKTAVRDELEKIAREADAGVEKQKALIRSITEEAGKLENSIKAFNEEQLLVSKKAMMEGELKRTEALEVPVPGKPVKPDTGKAEASLKEVRGKIRALEAHEKAAGIEKEMAGRRRLLETVEALAKAFDPKGAVFDGITSDYMKAFEEAANAKAEGIRHGMRMRFVPDGGVRAYLDTKGDGTFLGYESLSGGEKALFLYLILDLLNALSGFRILILDELSVLDREVFSALLALIREHEDEYDHIFLSAVSHDDTVACIEEAGIRTKVL